MRTIVISDLHLGGRTDGAVLQRPAALEPLLAALDGADRLVLLGDTVELRHGPRAEALAAARPVLDAIAVAMAGREIVVVPGNHDHGLIRAQLDERPPAGLDDRFEAPADLLEGATVAYPGLWLRDDVYATHGHYLDVHSTVPSFERLGAGLMARLHGAPPERGATPADYEAVLAPIYAWIDAAAARAAGRRAAGSGRSLETWQTLSGNGPRGLRARGLRAAFPLGVAVANRAGLGPVKRDVSGPAMRRGLLDGLREALRRLGVDAPHVLFGHTHRTGMLRADIPDEWQAGPTRLHNTGSWVYEPAFVGDGGAHAPHWPGGAIVVEDGEPPRLERLLGALSPRDLA